MNVTKHTENTLMSSDSESAPTPAKTSKSATSSQSQSQAKSNPRPASSSSSLSINLTRTPLEKEKPMGELLSEPFSSFDHQAAVVEPFTQEMGRDAAFEQELGTMLLDLVLETHAWSSARPKHESQTAVQKLEQKITDILEIEKEQGMFESFVMSESSVDGCGSRSGSSFSSCSSRSNSSRSVMSTLIGTRPTCPDLGALLLGYSGKPRTVTDLGFLTEKTRNNINEFVNHMKTALAALI